MITLGILFGLAAALCQSLSYLATRHFVHPRRGGSRQLLVLSHVIMGLISAGLLPLIWPGEFPPWSTLIKPLLATSLFYLLGQIGLMVCLRYAEPSRISPMLAFKLIVLALLTLWLKHTPITLPQWIAIGLCLGGAISLNYTGGANHPIAAVGLIFTCIAYSLSDWNIAALVKAMGSLPMWRGSILATLLDYCVCGIIAACFLPRLGSWKMRDWIDAGPFAISWLSAMLFLFACFGLVDVIYGNILQSTRGLISVVLGSILAGAGLLHFEKAAAPHVFARRLAAAALMLSAVVLYRVEWHPPRSPHSSPVPTIEPTRVADGAIAPDRQQP